MRKVWTTTCSTRSSGSMQMQTVLQRTVVIWQNVWIVYEWLDLLYLFVSWKPVMPFWLNLRMWLWGYHSYIVGYHSMSEAHRQPPPAHDQINGSRWPQWLDISHFACDCCLTIPFLDFSIFRLIAKSILTITSVFSFSEKMSRAALLKKYTHF